MKINHGPAAVRQHADDSGLTEVISAIVRAFGKDAIKDIEVHAEGEISVLHELSPQLDRIVPAVKSQREVSEYVKEARAFKR